MQQKTKTIKNKITLKSYSIKAIIPTGPYANIQSEIIISAKSLNEARDYVLPHIDELFERYLNKSERRVSTVTVKTNISTPTMKGKLIKNQVSGDGSLNPNNITDTVVVDDGKTDVVSLAYTKALTAINSCTSQEALNLITTQVEKSVKLTKQEKLDLLMVINKKKFDGK